MASTVKSSLNDFFRCDNIGAVACASDKYKLAVISPLGQSAMTELCDCWADCNIDGVVASSQHASFQKLKNSSWVSRHTGTFRHGIATATQALQKTQVMSIDAGNIVSQAQHCRDVHAFPNNNNTWTRSFPCNRQRTVPTVIVAI